MVCVYIVVFFSTVQRGHATYELDPPTRMRGGFAFYWFSDDTSLNRLGCKLYSPILRYVLNSRPYSSFATEKDRILWCETGNNIIMDDLAAVGIGQGEKGSGLF